MTASPRRSAPPLPRRRSPGTRARRSPGDLAILALPVLLALACSSGPAGPEKRLEDLAEARRLWEARGPVSYAFTYELACFCGGPGVPPARITVTEGRVTGAFLPSEDRQVPEEDLPAYPTVEELFGDVMTWFERDPASARAEFDPSLGHPVDVFVDFEAHVADEELGFRVRDLAPLEPPEGS